MLKKSNHIKRLMQPLPFLAAHVSKAVNFDVQVSIVKKSELATKGTVKKMKVTSADGDKTKTEALMEKVKKELSKFPTLEVKKGWIQIKAQAKKD
jgi:hypothetical protein